MRKRKCSNCTREDTPLWRKGFEGQILCNSCGLYWAKHHENPQKDEIVDSEHMDSKIKATKTPRDKKHKVENDESLDTMDVRAESPRLRNSSKPQTAEPASPALASLKVDLDLSKMTERQQIAYLLRESNGMEAAFHKESSGTEKTEKSSTKRSPSLGVKRPPIEELDEAWNVEEKPKRRKKDKLKKADTRNGSQKAVRKQRKNEAICTFCEDGGNLLMCEGPCLRSFHADCLGLKTQAPGKWECEDCSKHMSLCFFCKQKGEVGRELMKCKVHQCGKYYHYKCVSQLKLAKLINSKAKRFNCPLHYCATCEVSGDGKQSAHCFRCPTAYHVICMPSTARLLTDKSKETRKTGLILCPKHTNEPPLASRDPGANLLSVVEAEMNESEETHGGHESYESLANSSLINTDNDGEGFRGNDDSSSESYECEEDFPDGSHKGVMEDEDEKRKNRVVVDKAAEEVHKRHGHNSNAKKRVNNALKKNTCIEREVDSAMLFSLSTPLAATPISSPSIPSHPARHKNLDDVERDIMEEFDREAQNRFGLDLGVTQPPKQRQKKMDRIQVLENKFREEILEFKTNLVSMRDIMFARNQIEFESKVQLLRSEHHRLDIETEESLSRKFIDWGERILEQKRNVLKNTKLDNLSPVHSCANSSPTPVVASSPVPSLLSTPSNSLPIYATQEGVVSPKKFVEWSYDQLQKATQEVSPVCSVLRSSAVNDGIVPNSTVTDEPMHEYNTAIREVDTMADIDSLVSECMVSMSESSNL